MRQRTGFTDPLKPPSYINVFKPPTGPYFIHLWVKSHVRVNDWRSFTEPTRARSKYTLSARGNIRNNKEKVFYRQTGLRDRDKKNPKAEPRNIQSQSASVPWNPGYPCTAEVSPACGVTIPCLILTHASAIVSSTLLWFLSFPLSSIPSVPQICKDRNDP